MHAHGIAHRDIKLENLVFADRPSKGRSGGALAASSVVGSVVGGGSAPDGSEVLKLVDLGGAAWCAEPEAVLTGLVVRAALHAPRHTHTCLCKRL